MGYYWQFDKPFGDKTEETLEEIKQLEKRLKELRGCTQIKPELHIWQLFYNEEDDQIQTHNHTQWTKQNYTHKTWNYIRDLIRHIFQPKYHRESVNIYDLIPPHTTIAIQMAQEMLLLWNKYVKRIYAEELEQRSDVKWAYEDKKCNELGCVGECDMCVWNGVEDYISPKDRESFDILKELKKSIEKRS